MSYLGAKSGAGVYQAIIAAMPPHETYVEAFLGSGAIMTRKPPAVRSIGIDADRDAIEAFAEPGVELITGDAIAWIRTNAGTLGPRDLVYCDPPYLPETRLSHHRYRHELTKAQHAELLGVLRVCPAQVMISGYPSAMYFDALADWRRIEFQARTRGATRTECLWMNYPAGRVAWHTYAGQDFIDRQRIKRKAKSWARRFAACPPGERLAILAAMIESEGEDPSRA